MKSRRDIDEYRSSCQRMENWVPTAQGAMIRRTGSFFGSGTGGQLEPPPTPPDPPNFSSIDIQGNPVSAKAFQMSVASPFSSAF